MKKLALTLALGAFGFGIHTADVAAQTANQTVNASATILAYLNVAKLADVDFGAIVAGNAASLTPGVAPATGTLGVLQIDHNSTVSVAVALPAGGLSLVGGSGTEPKLPVTFDCGFSAASSGALAGSASTCAAMPNRLGNGDGTTRTSYVQIGGAIGSADTTNRIPGTYTGQLTFTVTAVY